MDARRIVKAGPACRRLEAGPGAEVLVAAADPAAVSPGRGRVPSAGGGAAAAAVASAPAVVVTVTAIGPPPSRQPLAGQDGEQ